MSSDPISPDPFVLKQIKKLEREAFDLGVKHGIQVAAQTVRVTGRGMWDHIASVIETRTPYADTR